MDSPLLHILGAVATQEAMAIPVEGAEGTRVEVDTRVAEVAASWPHNCSHL